MVKRNACPLVVGEQRRRRARTQVCEYDAADFAGGVGAMLELLFEMAIGRFGRRLHDAAVHVIFPTVVDAAKSALFIAPVEEGGATVGAGLLEQADAAVGIPKSHQPLAQK